MFNTVSQITTRTLCCIGLLLLAYVGSARASSEALKDRASAPPITVDPLWSFGLWGTGIGLSGIVVENLDDDPQQEIIVGGGYNFGQNEFWQVITYDDTRQIYVPEWRSKEYGLWINQIVVTDGPAEVGRAIFVLREDGVIEVYAAQDRRYLRSFSSPLQSGHNDMMAADIDRDGSSELLVNSGSALSVYNPLTLLLEWQITLPMGLDIGLRDLAVGNIDADPSLEIATLRQIVDVDTRTIQWDRSDGYDSQIALADLDRDGRDELIAARTGWNDVRVFDGATQQELRRIESWGSGIEALAVVQVDGDSRPEILIGNGQGAPLAVHDGVSGALLWSIGSPYGIGGFTTIVTADPDGDGTMELLWGGGWLNTGPDLFFVVDPATRLVEWTNVDDKGPFSNVGVGDLEGDGQNELVVLPYQSWDVNEQGALYLFDAQSHRLREKFGQGLAFSAPSPVLSLAVGDVDNDGADDVIVGGLDHSFEGAALEVYDGPTRKLKWRAYTPGGVTFSAVIVADVDGDGAAEVIAGQRQWLSGSRAALIVFDGATGQEEWRTAPLDDWGGVATLAVGNLDEDPSPELSFSATGTALENIFSTYGAIYDGVTHQLEIKTAFSGVSAVAIADYDGDGQAEWLLGRSDGRLMIYGGPAVELQLNLQISNAPITALAMYHPSERDEGLIALAIPDRIGVLDVAALAVRWTSPYLGVAVGAGGHLIAADIDDDGRFELVVGAESAISLWRDMTHSVAQPIPSPTSTALPTPSMTTTATPTPPSMTTTPTLTPPPATTTTTSTPPAGPADKRYMLFLPAIKR